MVVKKTSPKKAAQKKPRAKAAKPSTGAGDSQTETERREVLR